jgi:ribosomal peptide maturation radical SAM protein 1
VQRLPVESSRGCWWGAVSHCTFCGIADADMAFRAKSPDVVIASLAAVSARYNCTAFRFSDYILPHTYYRTLLPLLQEEPPRYALTGEIKANVKPEWMSLLKGAGFTEVQPGIESFSDRVLKGMAKGVGAIQNIQTLLLGRATGMVVHYNIIYAFPDDDLDDYLAMIEKLPRLFHLQAPSTRIPVQITRYAPLHETPERFGLPRATYATPYEMIFSERLCADTGFDFDAYCYYFDRQFENSPKLGAAYRSLVDLIDQWKKRDFDSRARLEFMADGDGLAVVDTRGSTPLTHRLDEDAANVLMAMRRPTTRDNLELSAGAGLTKERLSEVIADLDERGLFYSEGSQMICLALPAGEVQAEFVGIVEQPEKELSVAK